MARQPDRLAIPWWRIATTVLLIVALVLATAAGRSIEAVVIGLLLAPSLAVLVAWAYFATDGRR